MDQNQETEDPKSKTISAALADTDSTVINDSKPDEDAGLSALLDSCLEDFAPNPPPSDKLKSKKTNPPSRLPTASPELASGSDPDISQWPEQFKEFNKMMEGYLKDEGEFGDMQKLMNSFTDGISQTCESEDFKKNLSDTLQELSSNAHNVPEACPEELSALLEGLNLGDANDSFNDMMPLMQDVMHKLMSKELLYPSVKEVVEKYPDWLRENQATLSAQKYDNYKTQYELMVKVCEEFEKETDNSDKANNEQFEKIVQLMQKIQNCGNPPKELLLTGGAAGPFDADGNLLIPGMPKQCVMM